MGGGGGKGCFHCAGPTVGAIICIQDDFHCAGVMSPRRRFRFLQVIMYDMPFHLVQVVGDLNY